MANRVIRDWTTSEKIDILSPHAELFFVRLIMKADDHGCFHANPKLLRAALFPLREVMDIEIDKWLQECVNTGILFLYESEGRKYLKIVDFGQRLRNMRSQFPQPADNPQQVADNCPPHADKSRPETKRNEVETESETEVEKNFKSEFRHFDEWTEWGKLIVEKNDQHWQAMKGREISQSEMDSFLSVATRNDWKMRTQQQFRMSLKGFKLNDNANRNSKTSSSANTKSFSGEYEDRL